MEMKDYGIWIYHRSEFHLVKQPKKKKVNRYFKTDWKKKIRPYNAIDIYWKKPQRTGKNSLSNYNNGSLYI